jgi:hypothetical protein
MNPPGPRLLPLTGGVTERQTAGSLLTERFVVVALVHGRQPSI